jgi:hypothetical protein
MLWTTFRNSSGFVASGFQFSRSWPANPLTAGCGTSGPSREAPERAQKRPILRAMPGWNLQVAYLPPK